MDVSENGGTPKSSILIGISLINHPFWGTPIVGSTHISSKERYPRCEHHQRLARTRATSPRFLGLHSGFPNIQ